MTLVELVSQNLLCDADKGGLVGSDLQEFRVGHRTVIGSKGLLLPSHKLLRSPPKKSGGRVTAKPDPYFSNQPMPILQPIARVLLPGSVESKLKTRRRGGSRCKRTFRPLAKHTVPRYRNASAVCSTKVTSARAPISNCSRLHSGISRRRSRAPEGTHTAVRVAAKHPGFQTRIRGAHPNRSAGKSLNDELVTSDRQWDSPPSKGWLRV